MEYYYLFLHLSIIIDVYLMNYASSMHTEDVSSTFFNYQPNFGYQAAVIAKANVYFPNKLVGNGAVVSGNFVLTVADCVVNRSRQLKKFLFSVIVGGLPEIKIDFHIFKKVLKIHVHRQHYRTYSKYNLALLEIERIPNYENYLNLGKVEIPRKIELFEEKKAILSGYSPKKFKNISYPDHDIVGNSSEMESYTLQYVNAQIGKDGEICSTIQSSHTPKYEGQSEHQLGIPIIVRNKVVGLTIQINWDERRQTFCYLYTRLSNNYFFLDGAMRGVKNEHIRSFYFN